ncbi:3-dehydro-L-gulonate 2-dehydrogenase [candidate division KSB1 bacterium]|nr:3-dehydro-L-gulonate 2-dehydrogenase [candidate division KSB1 bacterium]
MLRIQYEDMRDEFERVLLKYDFTPSKARVCARVFAENSLEGVYSHGANRFPRFIHDIKAKHVFVDAEPEKMTWAGAFEQWNGNHGPGILNALVSADRAMELAKQYGIGCVGLAHTNHWMRGGTYGRKVANAGYVYMGWTNTIPNMPAWGAIDNKLGNNPMVLAVPAKNGPIVLDMAMSQFSYGKMEDLAMKNRQLPVAGGFNKSGQLSTDPKEILKTGRPLSIGCWKGAGLSLLLDIMAAILSGGLASFQIGLQDAEYNVSQVFIAFDTTNLINSHRISALVRHIIKDYKNSMPESESTGILFPGERVLLTRKENLEKGIPVNQSVWDTIKGL